MTTHEDRIFMLTETMKRAWCRDTSASPDRWTEARPSIGQCAVTALVVQDLFGGILLRTTNFGESHYLNELSDGENVDLTIDQFDDWAFTDFEERPREYLLGNLNTLQRYSLLLTRFSSEAQHLGEHYRTLTRLS